MRKIICDRCGRETGEIHSLRNYDRIYDLCETCAQKYDALWHKVQEENDARINRWLGMSNE